MSTVHFGRKKNREYLLFGHFVQIPPKVYHVQWINVYDFSHSGMLDHMMFAHEMEDGSVNTDVNATDSSYKNSSFSNSVDDDTCADFEEIEENGDRTMASMVVSENGSFDDMPILANMEVVFETSDENIVVVETVECNKPNSEENDGETMTKTTPCKSSGKITGAELETVKNTPVSTFLSSVSLHHEQKDVPKYYPKKCFVPTSPSIQCSFLISENHRWSIGRTYSLRMQKLLVLFYR